VAVLSGHGLSHPYFRRARLKPPGTLRILTDDPDGFADWASANSSFPNMAPAIEIDELNPPISWIAADGARFRGPPVGRPGHRWVIGRARNTVS